MDPVRVKVVVQAKAENVPGWPYINYNYQKKTEEILTCVRALNTDAVFDVFQYTSVEPAEKAYVQDCQNYDAILLLLMTNWIGLDGFYARRSVEGLPCAIAAVEYCGSGSILADVSPMVRKEKLPVPFTSSGDHYDIARLARTLVVDAKLKKTTILVVSKRKPGKEEEAAAGRFGCTFVNRSAMDLMAAFDQVIEEEARPVAKKWTACSLGVREPSEKDLLESAKLYLAVRAMAKECGAQAVTIDCLTLSYQDEYGKDRHMYPCLSHFQMFEDGMLGVCEADIHSTISSLIGVYMTGRNGFVSDPVIDTSSDSIIYAHCVASRRVYDTGDNRACDYYIRSHAEDQLGASVQVIFPANEKLTTFNMNVVKGWACIHSAVSIGNAGGDAGCRSKLVAKCDAQKLLDNWMPMWHRVTLFGDCRRGLMNFFRLKGLEITEEDK